MTETRKINHAQVLRPQSALGATDAAAVSLPSILGSTVILYSQVAPTALSAGVLAAFLGVAWVTLLTSPSSRPIAYTTRFFEAATLATLVLQSKLSISAPGGQQASVRVWPPPFFHGVAGSSARAKRCQPTTCAE